MLARVKDAEVELEDALLVDDELPRLGPEYAPLVDPPCSGLPHPSPPARGCQLGSSPATQSVIGGLVLLSLSVV